MLRQLVCAVLVFFSLPLSFAENWGVEVSTGVSSNLIDRGETLATLNNETSVTVVRALNVGEVYGGIYRISPLGRDASAFDEEVDYTLGFAFEEGELAVDVSANYLTYPGSPEEPSIELALGLGYEHFLSPEVASFYDLDLEIYGLEAAVAPTYEWDDWLFTGIARAGAVSADGEDYTYAGIETIAARELWSNIGLEGFARFEVADADNFVSNVEGDQILETRSDGLAIGLRLIASN